MIITAYFRIAELKRFTVMSIIGAGIVKNTAVEHGSIIMMKKL
jgi:hypothetical protein